VRAQTRKRREWRGAPRMPGAKRPAAVAAAAAAHKSPRFLVFLRGYCFSIPRGGVVAGRDAPGNSVIQHQNDESKELAARHAAVGGGGGSGSVDASAPRRAPRSTPRSPEALSPPCPVPCSFRTETSALS